MHDSLLLNYFSVFHFDSYCIHMVFLFVRTSEKINVVSGVSSLNIIIIGSINLFYRVECVSRARGVFLNDTQPIKKYFLDICYNHHTTRTVIVSLERLILKSREYF